MNRATLAALLVTATLPALSQTATPAAPSPVVTDDPYLWLEEVTGERALEWVRARNAESQPLLEARPGFKALEARLASIFSSKDRIPAVQARGGWLYNFWQDEANPRGIWRRTSMEEFRKP